MDLLISSYLSHLAIPNHLIYKQLPTFLYKTSQASKNLDLMLHGGIIQGPVPSPRLFVALMVLLIMTMLDYGVYVPALVELS